jgi:hypothetical protein
MNDNIIITGIEPSDENHPHLRSFWRDSGGSPVPSSMYSQKRIISKRDVRFGSIATVFRLPPHVRFEDKADAARTNGRQIIADGTV